MSDTMKVDFTTEEDLSCCPDEWLDTPMINLTVLAMEEKCEMRVHEGVFEQCSIGFQRLFQDEVMPEAIDFSMEVVKLYIHWMYSGGELYTEKIKKQRGETETVDKGWELLGQIYEFGANVQDTGLQDAVMDEFRENALLSDEFPIEMIPRIYEYSPFWEGESEYDSLHGKMVVEMVARNLGREAFCSMILEGVPKHFLRHLLLFLEPWRPNHEDSDSDKAPSSDEASSVDFFEDACKYHYHVDDECWKIRWAVDGDIGVDTWKFSGL